MKKTYVQEFQVNRDGFYGHLYHPNEDVYPGKALLVLGGGGVPYTSTMDIAEAFAGIGITSLSLGYFGVKDTPKTIVRVPLEYVEKAVDALHGMGMKAVIAGGISKGAELALIAASLLPQINGVIAFSPPEHVYMGVGSGISWAHASSWTFRGEEIPYAYAPSSGMKALGNSIHNRELTFRPVYEEADRVSSSDSLIPVEKIHGPVLLTAAQDDSLWPSAEACDHMIKRMDEAGFPYPHKSLIYRYACHLLLPFETPYIRLFRVGRQYPAECLETVHTLLSEVKEWLALEE